MIGRAETRAARRGLRASSCTPTTAPRCAPACADGEPHEIVFRVSNRFGEWRHLEAHVTDLRDDRQIRGVVLNARDITERVRLEEELTHQAFHDGLTGLANRALFRDRLDQALARSARSRRRRSPCCSSTSTGSSRSTTASATTPATSCSGQVARALRPRSRGRATRSRASAATSSRCCSRARDEPRRSPSPARCSSGSPSRCRSPGASSSLGASIGIAVHAGGRGAQRGARPRTPTSRCTRRRRPAAAATRSSAPRWRASSASCSGSSTSCAGARSAASSASTTSPRSTSAAGAIVGRRGARALALADARASSCPTSSSRSPRRPA